MKKIKFYGVRKGREPGMYFSWEDCKAQVNGFPNAEYKGFDTPEEAENYLADIGLLSVEDLCLEDVLIAYTDGSYLDGKAGYGAVFVYNNKVIGKLCGQVEDPQSRNVSGELMAVIAAVKSAAARECKELVICHDLMGVQMWADGLWKCNKKESIEFEEFIRQKRESGMAIGFGWLHGHTGQTYNEMADELAKDGAINGKKKAAGFPVEKGAFVPA